MKTGMWKCTELGERQQHRRRLVKTGRRCRSCADKELPPLSLPSCRRRMRWSQLRLQCRTSRRPGNQAVGARDGVTLLSVVRLRAEGGKIRWCMPPISEPTTPCHGVRARHRDKRKNIRPDPRPAPRSKVPSLSGQVVALWTRHGDGLAASKGVETIGFGNA